MHPNVHKLKKKKLITENRLDIHWWSNTWLPRIEYDESLEVLRFVQGGPGVRWPAEGMTLQLVSDYETQELHFQFLSMVRRGCRCSRTLKVRMVRHSQMDSEVFLRLWWMFTLETAGFLDRKTLIFILQILHFSIFFVGDAHMGSTVGHSCWKC